MIFVAVLQDFSLDMKTDSIIVYTDGSCNPKHSIGGWVAILFIGDEKKILSGVVNKTTHQRMELVAVIKSFEYLANLQIQSAELYTDSQYVVGISGRKLKLEKAGFVTSKNKPISNVDLVRTFVGFIETLNIRFVKVKAHLNTSELNFNREADKLARKIVREAVNKIIC